MDSIETRFSTHEAVCAERWKEAMARMRRIETVLLWATGSLVMGMGGVIVTLALRSHP